MNTEVNTTDEYNGACPHPNPLNNSNIDRELKYVSFHRWATMAWRGSTCWTR